MSKGVILLADDERSIRTVLTHAFMRAGYEVKSTGVAAMLWKWVADGLGDLVVTDVKMPDENGLDLLVKIQKARPNLRVIVVSGQNTLLTAIQATERGAFEYFTKPFDMRELLGAVDIATRSVRVRAVVSWTSNSAIGASSSTVWRTSDAMALSRPNTISRPWPWRCATLCCRSDSAAALTNRITPSACTTRTAAGSALITSLALAGAIYSEPSTKRPISRLFLIRLFYRHFVILATPTQRNPLSNL